MDFEYQPEKKTEKKRETLNFKPINSGLGFHPFSDGLPYAPVTPSTRASTRTQLPPRAATSAPLAGPMAAAGATVAGRPRVAPAVLSRSPVQATVATPAPMVSPAPAPSQPEMRTSWAFLPKRVFAYAFDLIFAAAFCLVSLAFLMMQQRLDASQFFHPSVLLIGGVFLMVLCWALIAAQEVAFGTSLGKRLFGLKLQGSAGAIFLRAALFIPSGLIFGLGLLWAFFDSRRRCWHDLAAGVRVVEITRL